MPQAYKVMDPKESFLGKTYVDWIEDWSRWLYIANPDQNNSGPVVFLRGMPLSSTAGYMGQANVMVGNDSLEISKNQKILIPVITATALAEGAESSQTLYELVRSDIYNGDDPPLRSQLLIDNEPIVVDHSDLRSYKFETRVFQLFVPAAEYGQSLADFLQPPIKRRGETFPCVTAGYFVIIELNTSPHNIICAANGARDERGLYRSSLFYRIIVRAQPPKPESVVPNPLSGDLSIYRISIESALRKKHTNGDIGEDEFNSLTDALTNTKSIIGTPAPPRGSKGNKELGRK